MARHVITHSEDGTTITIRGDIRHPEPSTAVIRFPGGFVEVSRHSDGSYWAHVGAQAADIPEDDPGFGIVESRVDYDREGWIEHGIPPIPAQERVQRLAMRFAKIASHPPQQKKEIPCDSQLSLLP